MYARLKLPRAQLSFHAPHANIPLTGALEESLAGAKLSPDVIALAQPMDVRFFDGDPMTLMRGQTAMIKLD